MSVADADTTIAIVLADDLRARGYVECPWRGLTIGGFVELPDGVVTSFSAERHGVPVRVPSADMPFAIAELIAAARELQPESVS